MYKNILTYADTDSIQFCKPDSTRFTDQEIEDILQHLNSLLPERINLEFDGQIDKLIVLKTKNYIKSFGDKIEKKGSALIDQKKEKILSELINEIITHLLEDRLNDLVGLYEKYIKLCFNIGEITKYTTKKTVTDSVLNPERLNERKVFDAILGRNLCEGDKVFLYTAVNGMKQTIVKGELQFSKSGEPKMETNYILKMVEDYDPENCDFANDKFVKRVYSTFDIFKNVIDMGKFVKYYNKGKKEELENLVRK